jgi:GntR family transcriptional regulator
VIGGHGEQPGGRRDDAVDRARKAIISMIAEESLKAGDRIATEPELAKRLGVGRSTLREALKALEQEGLVAAVQGHGRFVSGSAALAVERPITKYEGIGELLGGLGYVVTTAVLHVTEDVATEEEAGALEVEVGHAVIRVTRLRFGDGAPLVYSTNAVLREALPGPIEHRDWAGSLTAMLAAHGHAIVSSSARISAVELPASAEAAYSLGGLGPWLLVSEICVTRSGRRVLLADDYHRGQKVGFNVLRRR